MPFSVACTVEAGAGADTVLTQTKLPVAESGHGRLEHQALPFARHRLAGGPLMRDGVALLILQRAIAVRYSPHREIPSPDRIERSDSPPRRGD